MSLLVLTLSAITIAAAEKGKTDEPGRAGAGRKIQSVISLPNSKSPRTTCPAVKRTIATGNAALRQDRNFSPRKLPSKTPVGLDILG